MSDQRKLMLRDMALLLAMLLPLFLLLLGSRPLNVPDEGRYPEIAREMLLSGDFITPRVNGALFLDKPTLYYWLQAASYQVLGVSIASIRLMPALFGLAGCLLVFVTGWRLFNRRTAWLASLILATSPLYFLASQYANLDLEVAIWISTSLCLFLLARQQSPASNLRRALFVLAYLAGGMGVMTKGLIGIVLPSIAIFGWMVWRNRWRELPSWSLLWFAPAVLLICLPWYLAVQQANPEFFHYFFIFQQFQRFTSGGFNNAFPWWFYFAVLGLFMLPWSLWLPVSITHAWQQRRANGESYAFLLAWPVMIFVFFSLPASKIVSYILPTVPPLALLMAAYLDHKLAKQQSSPRLALAIGMLFSIAALGLWLYTPQLRLKYPEQASFGWLLHLLAITLAGAAGLAAWAFWRRHMAPLLAACLLAGLSLSATLGPIIGCVDQKSSLPAANALKPFLHDDAIVVSYLNYYQDLPLYLNRREPIRVVENWQNPELAHNDSWRREFYYALGWRPETAKWLISEQAFGDLLRQPRPVFVVLDSDVATSIAERYHLIVLWQSKQHAILGQVGSRPQSTR